MRVYDRGEQEVLAAERTLATQTALARASRRRMTCSIRLSGVDAPAVSPTWTEPLGSQPPLPLSCLLEAGRCLISPADNSPSGSEMWNVGSRSAHMRARLNVLLLL